VSSGCPLKKSPQKLIMILVVIQRLIGAPLARVGKSQESRVATRTVCMYEAIGGQRPPKDHWPQATKTPRAVSPPKQIKFQNWYSVELEKHFTLGTTTAAFHRRWCHPPAGAPLLRNPCNPGKPNILAKPSKRREPPPLA
jgi:hypothetical protein